jgi:hypothetical protein
LPSGAIVALGYLVDFRSVAAERAVETHTEPSLLVGGTAISLRFGKSIEDFNWQVCGRRAGAIAKILRIRIVVQATKAS